MFQLYPYYQVNFTCDNCQQGFHKETAYSPVKNADLSERIITYCSDCMVEETATTCSFVDTQARPIIVCDKPLFDKKKQLCRSHNRQVRKRFNEFTRGMSISGDAAWEMAWEQSGDWQYFWKLGKNKEKDKLSREEKVLTSKNTSLDKRKTGRTRQLNLKVKEETYWLLREMALKEKCLMTEIVEKALRVYLKKKD